MELVSQAELSALEDIVVAGMKTDVAVLRLQTIEVSDGDDYRGWVETETTTGWLWEPPDYPTGGDVGGVIGAATDHRLFLRSGIEATPGDRIGVDGVLYEILNTNQSNTFQVMLRLALRRVE